MSILSLVFLLSQIAQAPGNYNSLMDDLASGNEKRALSTADPFGALSGLANYRRKVNPKVVMKLASALSRGGADPNRREEPTKYKNYVSTQPGPTQLHKLAMAGTHTEPFDTISRHNIYWITKAILSAPRCDPNLLDSNDLQTRDTPLTLYLRWHYEKSGVFLKAMVESPKTDVNKRGGAQQQYPLHTAAWLGRLDWVKLLVEHGAKINIQKENGQTALHAAAMENTKGNADVITYLLKKGARADFRSKGATGYLQNLEPSAPTETPLEIARRKGFKRIIAALTQR